MAEFTEYGFPPWKLVYPDGSVRLRVRLFGGVGEVWIRVVQGTDFQGRGMILGHGKEELVDYAEGTEVIIPRVLSTKLLRPLDLTVC